jgi:hypothetical protein
LRRKKACWKEVPFTEKLAAYRRAILYLGKASERGCALKDLRLRDSEIVGVLFPYLVGIFSGGVKMRYV